MRANKFISVSKYGVLYDFNQRLRFFWILLVLFFNNQAGIGQDCADYYLFCNTNVEGYTWWHGNRVSESEYGACTSDLFSDFNARDVIIQVSGSQGDVILLDMEAGIDLDLFLFSDCPDTGGGGSFSESQSCIARSIASSGPEEITLPYSGDFYIVIDGYNEFQEGYFNVHMYCSIDCISAQQLSCDESIRDWNGCGPYPPDGGFYVCQDAITYLECSPKEYDHYHRDYTFTAPTSGTYTFSLTELENDVDLFLFYDYCGVTTNNLYCGEYSINSGSSVENITVNLTSGQTIYLLVDGPEISPFTLDVTCGNDPCLDCWNCFYFGRKNSEERVFEMNSSFCYSGMPVENQQKLQSETRYEWSVQGGQVEYIENTSFNSPHPVMRFPGSGTYVVCMKIYAGTTNTLLYECCQRVIVSGPCSSPPTPFFNYTYESSNQSFLLNAPNTTNGDYLLWDFSSNDNNQPVTVLEGNANSLSTRIIIPEFRCKEVCLSVSNACGMSTYCVTLCRSSSSCQGNSPTHNLTSPIVPIINNRTITFPTLPNPPSGTNVTYEWNFGDGGKSQAKNPTYTYGEFGYYRVCLIIRVGCKKICYCWNVHVNPCPLVYEPHNNMLSFQFNGNENNLNYTIFSQGIQIAQDKPWLVDNQSVNNSQNSPNLIVSLPQDRDYNICFPYYKSNGCLAYKCIIIRGGNPFSCSNIQTTYSMNSGYQFSLPSGSSEIEWKVDETGQNLGNSINSAYLPPIFPCTWRTISVRYFDGSRYRICCIRVYICSPDDCYSNIYLGDSGSQVQFTLQEQGATQISWYFDDAPGNILGNTSQINVNYPSNCSARWISVRYKDAFGRWRVCCRLVYFCNPFQCSGIIPLYNESSGYQFELDQNYSNIEWTVDETGQNLGNSKLSSYLPLPGESCTYRTISARYRHPSGYWVLCCIRIWWCNPTLCQDKIIVTKNGDNFILSTENTFTQINWYNGSQYLGNANPLSTTLQGSSPFKICVRYYNPSSKSWFWCCYSFSPGGGISCDSYTPVFKEDFQSGSPNGYGYNNLDKIEKNAQWWKGDGIVQSASGKIAAGQILLLTFGKNTTQYSRVKVEFDIIVPWYRNLMTGTYAYNLEGGFSLNSENWAYNYTLNQMLNQQPNLIQPCGGGADIIFCNHKVEVLLEKNGLAEVYIDGKKVNHIFPFTGDIVKNINFYGDITIDNVSVGECRTNAPFQNVILDISNDICGPSNTEILVPVTVKNYKNISGLQCKISSLDNNIAEITGFSNINSNSGITPIDFALVDKKLVLTYAFSNYTLNDNDKLFDIKVLLKSISGSSVNLVFEGELKALNENGQSLPITGLNGSVCVNNNQLVISGNISNQKTKGIPNVKILGSGSQNTFTNTSGNYQATSLLSGSNYTIKPELDESLSSGVDISDLFLLRRHMQGLSLFGNPYTYVAADINIDKIIDISDLFILRRIMQGLTTQLPNGMKSWRFVPKSYIFPGGNPLSNNIPESISFNPLSSNQINQDFIGVKFGDLDHSKIPLIEDPIENRNSDNVEFTFDNITAPSGSTIDLAIRCKNLEKAAVMQFSMEWPTDKLELLSVPAGNNIAIPGTTLFDETQRNSGKLGIIWETDNFNSGTTLPDGSIIYKFTFKLIGQNPSTAMISNSNTPKNAKLLNVDGLELPLIINSGTVQIDMSNAIDGLNASVLKIFPNPTKGLIQISDYENHKIHNLILLDSQGKECSYKCENGNIDISGMPSGLYIMKALINQRWYVARIVKIE